MPLSKIFCASTSNAIFWRRKSNKAHQRHSTPQGNGWPGKPQCTPPALLTVGHLIGLVQRQLQSRDRQGFAWLAWAVFSTPTELNLSEKWEPLPIVGKSDWLFQSKENVIDWFFPGLIESHPPKMCSFSWDSLVWSYWKTKTEGREKGRKEGKVIKSDGSRKNKRWPAATFVTAIVIGTDCRVCRWNWRMIPSLPKSLWPYQCDGAG